MEKSDLNNLPPTKRFKLFHLLHHSSPYESTLCLPAKKRLVVATAYPLPAKKRVLALPSLSPSEIHQEFIETSFEIDIEKKSEEQINPISVVVEGEDNDDYGVVCSVCRIGDAQPENPIVFCDGCNLMVHSSCYGDPLVKSIPEGDWFCLRCEAGKAVAESSERCCLCPSKGGALKPTTDGSRWAHLACALLVPEVFFRDPKGRSGIDCSRVPERRWEGECYLCKGSSGCMLECSEATCPLRFHVSCARDEGLCVEYMERKKGTKGIVVSFCNEHTMLWEKQQSTGKFKIVAREQNPKGKKRRT